MVLAWEKLHTCELRLEGHQNNLVVRHEKRQHVDQNLRSLILVELDRSNQHTEELYPATQAAALFLLLADALYLASLSSVVPCLENLMCVVLRHLSLSAAVMHLEIGPLIVPTPPIRLRVVPSQEILPDVELSRLLRLADENFLASQEQLLEPELLTQQLHDHILVAHLAGVAYLQVRPAVEPCLASPSPVVAFLVTSPGEPHH